MNRGAQRRSVGIWERLEQSETGRAHLKALEEWLKVQPEPERSELTANLHRSDEEFYSAELELYIGNALSDLGLQFRRHPTLEHSEKSPDYLVAPQEPLLPFFIEARASIDVEMLSRDAAMRALRDELNSIQGPEWVHLTVDGDFPGDFSVRRAARAIGEALTDLRTRSAVGERMVAYSHGPCSLHIEIFDVDSKMTGPVVRGWQFGSMAKTLDTDDALARAITRKAGRYGELNAPFIIAVFARHDFPLVRHSVVTALYGTRKWNFLESNDATTPLMYLGETSTRDGIFTAWHDGEPIRTSVSAIAIYDRRDRIDGRGTQYDFAILHNPFAKYPLDLSIFDGVSQFVRDDQRSNGDAITMRWLSSVPEWWD